MGNDTAVLPRIEACRCSFVARWLLVPITAVAVWAGTLLIGISSVSLLDSLCPPNLMVSGACMASWHRPAVAGLEMFCAGIAAVSFVILPAWVAPAYRVQVAVVCFVVGGLLTLTLAIAGALWAPSAVAAIAGVAALRVIVSRASTGFAQGHSDRSRSRSSD